MIKRVNFTKLAGGLEFLPPLDVPFVLTYRGYDIPPTIAAMIRNAPANMVAMGLNISGGFKMVRAAEREARKKNIRILWNRFGLEKNVKEINEIHGGGPGKALLR